MQKQTFVQGTLVLTVSALITRILGFVNGIILARLLGAEGMGLLMMAHPLVPLVITLTGLGLPVAITKLVAEAEVKGDHTRVKRILLVSLTVTCSLSVGLTALTYFGSEWIGKIFLADPRAYYAMLAITPIAPIVAISSVLKGYFQGKQNMKSIAISEIIEHIVQIFGIVAMVRYLLPFGIEFAAAGAMAAAVLGEFAGLIFMSSLYWFQRKKNTAKIHLSPALSKEKRTFRELMDIGLPTSGHGIVYSIYSAFQPMLVTASLAIAGITAIAATRQYGLLVGYAFPLLILPGFITHSLSTALMPAISEAQANGNTFLLHRRIDQAMRIALIVGAPSTVILYVWATPLTSIIYHAPEAGHLLRILAPIFFLHYFEGPLHAILLGLGKANVAMWNFVFTTILKVAAIFMMGSNFGIDGVAMGVGFGVCFITLLNFFSISGMIGFYLDLRVLAKVALSMSFMVVCGLSAYLFSLKLGCPLSLGVPAAVIVALAVYFMSLAATRTFARGKTAEV
ncbi:MAG: stage sporulation protein [Paenibacillaceae bacterium]|jgi:stage V sporulation protein B|nr:stage sporulation protein [Paenibacillaceae bacterium]